MSAAAITHDHAHGADHAHDHDHHEPGFWRKYIFSTDHKVIGVQYGLSGLVFLLFGFMLMLMMRWSIAYPGQPVPGLDLLNHLPIIGPIVHEMMGRFAPDGVINGELYNMLGAMHGTIMVFFGIVPLGFAAFGELRHAFANRHHRHGLPEAEHAELLVLLPQRRLMMLSFFVGTGAVQTGWTMYSPLASTTSIMA
jgi:cytochrome c oxidase subunit 1